MENERLATVEEQLRWMGPRVERIEMKLDHLISRSELRWGKILGIAAFLAFVVSLAVEISRTR